MPNLFRRMIDAVSGRRSLEAGSNGRRMSHVGRITSLNNEIQARNATIRARAANFARNNPHVSAGISALVSNIVGPGIKPSSQHPDEKQRERLHALWARWIDLCDIENGGDFYALQALMVRQMAEAGESFARMAVTRPVAGEIPLKLQVIHPSQVPMDVIWSPNAPKLRAGIEYSADGLERIAYHILPYHPEDAFQVGYDAWKLVRVPAEDICHLFDRLEPGQVRGLSWLAPVLTIVNELDQLQDAALVRAKLGNLICAGLISPDPADATGLMRAGTQADDVLDVTLEPGTILPFKGGSSLEFFEPKESVNYGPFVKNHMQAIAAGMGIPYELLTGDLSSVNYSSIRAGLVEFRKKVEHWQYNVVVFRLCRPVWDRFIRLAVVAGEINAAAYANDPAAFHRVEWLPPKPQWVDPKKDIEAEVAAVNAGFKSRTQVITSMGYDPEQVDREISADQKREKRLKLTIVRGSSAPSPYGGPVQENGDA